MSLFAIYEVKRKVWQAGRAVASRSRVVRIETAGRPSEFHAALLKVLAER